MINVIFVCLGNICRSPMAELIFKKQVKDAGLSLSFNVTSFGTSDCEEGNSIYPPAKRTLEKYGVEGTHRAKQISLKDIINSDFVLVMDSSNLIDILRLTGSKYREKIFKLCDFTEAPRDVQDPWYTRDFERAYSDISEGCAAFLKYIETNRAEMLNYDIRH